MRNKILAVIVALGGFASLAVVSATTAQASSSHATTTTSSNGATVTGAPELCPAGVTPGPSVCAYYCPSGTLTTSYKSTSGTTFNGEYCEVAAVSPTTTTVLPQGPPTEFGAVMWGAKGKFAKLRHGHISISLFIPSSKGPALKVHIKSGINGAPFIRSATITAPAGFYFNPPPKQKNTLAVDGPERSIELKTLTETFRATVGSVLFYLKKGSMHETLAERKFLAKHPNATVPFTLLVVDASGLKTTLSFAVKPNS